jgi:hypothetical protein
MHEMSRSKTKEMLNWVKLFADFLVHLRFHLLWSVTAAIPRKGLNVDLLRKGGSSRRRCRPIRSSFKDIVTCDR